MSNYFARNLDLLSDVELRKIPHAGRFPAVAVGNQLKNGVAVFRVEKNYVAYCSL